MSDHGRVSLSPTRSARRGAATATLLILTLVATPAPSPSEAAPPGAGERAAPATSGAQGVAVWDMRGVSTALARSSAHWYYTWAVEHDGVRTPRGTTFVPMVWGEGSVTRDALARVRREPSRHLLTFNEPDLAEQSNMSVARALELWPRLQRTGKLLSSPAVAWGGADPGSWLDLFMRGAQRRDLRVDFVALHWYGGDFHARRATDQLRQYIQAVHRRYHRPIWLTEFALMRFEAGGAVVAPTRVQAAFARRAAEMLERLPYVRRYAWFGLPAAARGPSTGLFRPGARITPVGRAYRSAG